jgi:hypothetical protein
MQVLNVVRMRGHLGWAQILLTALWLTAWSTRTARADDTVLVEPIPAEVARAPDVSPQVVEPLRAHGPDAPDGQFPSQVFQWEAHAPRRMQIAFTYGLSHQRIGCPDVTFAPFAR